MAMECTNGPVAEKVGAADTCRDIAFYLDLSRRSALDAWMVNTGDSGASTARPKFHKITSSLVTPLV